MSKPTRPVNLWCSYFFVLAATLQLCSWEPLCAQQRDPAVEIYGLMGTYYFGNSQNCQGRSKFGPLRRSKSRPVGEGVAVFVGRLERSLRSPFRAAQA